MPRQPYQNNREHVFDQLTSICCNGNGKLQMKQQIDFMAKIFMCTTDRQQSKTVCWESDIQQMFYCFLVRNDHSNFLRFLWFRDNYPMKGFREYRMRVHGFGNSTLPALAIYGLRPRPHEAETGETVPVLINPVSEYLRKDGVK